MYLRKPHSPGLGSAKKMKKVLMWLIMTPTTIVAPSSLPQLLMTLCSLGLKKQMDLYFADKVEIFWLFNWAAG